MRDSDTTALSGILVTELGDRIGTAVCSSWLAQLGATVVVVETTSQRSEKSKHRNQLCAGKLSFVPDFTCDADVQLLTSLISASDLVVTSSDTAEAQMVSAMPSRAPRQVFCDITAFGQGGAIEGNGLSDAQLQALTGILDTTGADGSPPALIPIPVIEYLGGMHSAGACLAALRTHLQTGVGQDIDMALYDAGFFAISSFLTRNLSDGDTGPTRRIGNRHSLSAPWNVYQATDGWVQICTGSDIQWRRLCGLIGRDELADDVRFKTSTARVADIDAVDGLVQEWIKDHTVEDSVRLLNAAHIPSGPIVRIDQFPNERNLLHRNMILDGCDPATSRPVFLPGSPFKMSLSPGQGLRRIPAPNADREDIQQLVVGRHTRPIGIKHAIPEAPLAGIRVIEIGHYTTAPVAARFMAGLGADVIKIEPPEGEASRTWPPVKAGQSLFYTVSNSDKRAITLDITVPEGREQLTALLKTADVLIENLKPGTLARRGFSDEALKAINPRLIYCAISGFGAQSLYAGRAAFDTVVQAMSGLMDILKIGETPLKAGISIADLMGASTGLAAVIAALIVRDRTGLGQSIDLSMQDALAWSTQLAWNGQGAAPGRQELVECVDGAVLVHSEEAGRLPRDLQARGKITRAAFMAQCQVAEISAIPIHSPFAALDAEQTKRRNLVIYGEDERGKLPALGSPLRLSLAPYRLRAIAPALGRHNEEILGRKELFSENIR